MHLTQMTHKGSKCRLWQLVQYLVGVHHVVN